MFPNIFADLVGVQNDVPTLHQQLLLSLGSLAILKHLLKPLSPQTAFADFLAKCTYKVNILIIHNTFYSALLKSQFCRQNVF